MTTFRHAKFCGLRTAAGINSVVSAKPGLCSLCKRHAITVGCSHHGKALCAVHYGDMCEKNGWNCWLSRCLNEKLVELGIENTDLMDVDNEKIKDYFPIIDDGHFHKNLLIQKANAERAKVNAINRLLARDEKAREDRIIHAVSQKADLESEEESNDDYEEDSSDDESDDDDSGDSDDNSEDKDSDSSEDVDEDSSSESVDVEVEESSNRDWKSCGSSDSASLCEGAMLLQRLFFDDDLKRSPGPSDLKGSTLYTDDPMDVDKEFTGICISNKCGKNLATRTTFINLVDD